MGMCRECRERVTEKIDEWLFSGMEGGIIGTSGHWAEEERKRCEPFLFHWGVDYDFDGWDEETEDDSSKNFAVPIPDGHPHPGCMNEPR